MTSNEQYNSRKGKLNASCFHTKKDDQQFLEKDRDLLSPGLQTFQQHHLAASVELNLPLGGTALARLAKIEGCRASFEVD